MSLQDPNGIRLPQENVETEDGHVPVLAGEVLEFLAPVPGSLQIDGTLGGGGHTEHPGHRSDAVDGSRHGVRA